MKKFLKLSDDDYLAIEGIARVQFGKKNVAKPGPQSVYGDVTYEPGPDCVWIWRTGYDDSVQSTKPEVIEAARNLVENWTTQQS